jgi:hypothetical protein
MTPVPSDAGSGEDDELPSEKNAHLIMGVCTTPNLCHVIHLRPCLTNHVDQQQQYCVKEKCRASLLTQATLLSLLCQKTAAEVPHHQSWLLAQNESHRLGCAQVPRTSHRPTESHHQPWCRIVCKGI